MSSRTSLEIHGASAEDELVELRNILQLRRERVGELEYTSGNHDDDGRLIEQRIPTMTTELCEIGIHADIMYFVVIMPSGEFSRELFDALRGQDVKIYGLKDFDMTIYKSGDKSTYEDVIFRLQDDFIQCQFDLSWRVASVEEAGERYFQIKEAFLQFGTKIVNQLDCDLRQLAN